MRLEEIRAVEPRGRHRIEKSLLRTSAAEEPGSKPRMASTSAGFDSKGMVAGISQKICPSEHTTNGARPPMSTANARHLTW